MQKLTSRQEQVLSNLHAAVRALYGAENHIADFAFRIQPVVEPASLYSSTDDVMRLWPLAHLKADHILTATELVCFLTAPHDRFPLWIELVLEADQPIIIAKISQRFRRYAELHHRSTGHPPFRLTHTTVD